MEDGDRHGDGMAAEGFRRCGVEGGEWCGSRSPGKRSESLGHPWIPDSVKTLRHSFTVNKPVKSARLYATALGSYELYLNGVNGGRVGDEVLAPGWTDYRERVVYQNLRCDGPDRAGQKNAIAALLAPGWYETPLEWFQQPNNYGVTPPALRAQLRIEHTDGTVEWVVTDRELAGGRIRNPPLGDIRRDDNGHASRMGGRVQPGL